MASDGTIPTPEDFDEQRQDLNPTVFPSFGGAVEHAHRRIRARRKWG
jgi:hypothetical protein